MKTILSLIAALYLSALLALGSVNFQQPDLDTAECSGKWIHIRNLPTRFNVDLLANCSDFRLFDDFCPYLANHGLGQKAHNQTRSWYRTEPFMLELIFHRRMLEYPCLTADPAVASAIFLPYYAGIDSLRYLYGGDVNSSFEHGLDLFQFLKHHDSPQIWENHQGHDHFLVMARPAWDFSQSVSYDQPIWGTSFLELPEFYNITALTLESRTWPWQEQAVPYPTSFHPPNTALFEAWVTRVRNSRRSTLMVFAGGGGSSSSPNIRRSIRLECKNSANSSETNGGYSKSCEFIDCSNGVCEHDPNRFMRPMLQSKFCLQPPGDTPSRRSTFDGIIAGCIPVFFENQSAKTQYTWHLPEDKYSDFSVYIPKEDVVFKGVKILDVLLGIPRDEVRRMRERVLAIMPRVMYRKHGSSLGLRTKKDAFDIAIEGTLQRIKARLQ
ncbi:exostosin family protein [Actinidia rufa]|uniref:Exostosin family protein n=1 Tax=Actinidia rufa TaxID=165716 RepID=A0A7J0FTB1_9ERIC|nr:exostosin family protein [Actinidia rufa]